MPRKRSVSVWEDGDRLRYRDARGKAQSGGTYHDPKKRKEAKKRLEDRLRLHHLGECDPTMDLQIAWEAYKSDLADGFANRKGLKLRPSSIVTIGHHLSHLLERAKVVGDLEPELCKEMLSDVAEDLGDWSVYGIRKDCAAFCRYLQRRRILDVNPFDELPVSRPDSRPRYYTDDELEALEKAAEGLEIHAWLRLGYLAGLRYSEILNIHWQNIRLHENGTGELAIWGHQSKNRHPRTVPLCREIVSLLGSRRDDLLFAGWNRGKFRYQWFKLKYAANLVENSKRLSGRNYGWTKEKVVNIPEDDSCRFHDLRHTFCKLYLQEGGRIEKLQKITGHKSLEVLTNVYGHFETKHLFADVEAINLRPKFLEQKRSRMEIIEVKPADIQSNQPTSTELDKMYNLGEN